MKKITADKTLKVIAGFALWTALSIVSFDHDALAASSKPLSVISADVFTVGDVFTDIDDAKALKVLGPSPQPGKELTLNAATLLQISRAFNLGWKPANMTDKVTIRRGASIVETQTIHGLIMDELRKKGVTGKFDLTLNETNSRIVMPEGYDQTAEVTSIRFDPARDWVEASLAAPSAKNPVGQIMVSGKVQRFAKVPVLKESLTNGMVIGKSDIILIEVPTQTLQAETVLSFERLDGMTPRRMIEAGKPVRDTELEKPQIVSRGDQITIIYENGPIKLTTRGKAMQGGARGDMVQIVNLSSNKSLQATISGDREVTIID